MDGRRETALALCSLSERSLTLSLALVIERHEILLIRTSPDSDISMGCLAQFRSVCYHRFS